MDSDSAAWRDHSGFIAWPTVALALTTFALWVANLAGLAAGVVPWTVSFPVGIVLVYLSFTPLHEATHGNVSGGVGGWAWLDPAIGWIAGVPLLAPFPAVRAVHLHHHAHTNDPEQDPDHLIHGAGWSTVRGALGMWLHYIRVYWLDLSTRSATARRDRRPVALALVAMIGSLLVASLGGHLTSVLFGVALPAWLGVALLAFAFDWLPHWPHDRRERFRDTRALPERWLDTPLLGQNLHLVHHLWPRVPFYRYRAVFEASRSLLASHDSPIEPVPTLLARLRAAR